MNKMAIYVEGQTEMVFIEKLITEIANRNSIKIESYKIRGGSKVPLTVLKIKEISTSCPQYYIQIYDCGNDSKVQSKIQEDSLKLQEANFKKILGLRDLYPLQLTELPNLLKYTKPKIKDLEIPAKTIICITEIESWFLYEFLFLSKVDPYLTAENIKANLSYDLENDCINGNIETDSRYHHATQVLEKIYKLALKKYKKKLDRTEKLVDLLDYERIYLEIRQYSKSLGAFLKELDEFFSLT